MNKTRLKTNIIAILQVIGISGLLGMSTVLYIVFTGTYLTGGHGTIDVNSIGEANIELVLFTIIMILGISAIINYIRQKRKEIYG